MTCTHDISRRIAPPDEQGLQDMTCGDCDELLARLESDGTEHPVPSTG